MPRRVHIEAAVITFGRHVQQVAAAHHRNAGVVDEGGERTQRRLGAVQQRGMIRDTGNVAGSDAAAALGGDGGGPRRVPPMARHHRGDVESGIRQCQRNGLADAAAGAGDERYLASGNAPQIARRDPFMPGP